MHHCSNGKQLTVKIMALDDKLQIYKGIFYSFVTNTGIFAVFSIKKQMKRKKQISLHPCR